ncbi:MAG: MFS transporter [Gemmatimonadaceae bacterium]|nr:MFS transporter [Gemmatimonadaceae bacterium]
MSVPPDPAPAEEVNVERQRRNLRRWILAALMSTMMLAAMDTTIVATAIPQIVGDLGGFALLSWVFSIYLLAQTVTIPVYGKLSDIFGRKPVLVIGTLIFLTGSAVSAASWSMVSLIVFRGLQGLGAGAIIATVSTLAGDLYSIRERAAIQGWLSSVWGISAIVGPTLGGVFAEYASWRWIFLVNLPIGALALVLIGGFLHEEFERRRPSIDVAGAALVLLSAGTLIFGLLQGGTAWPWASRSSIAVFAIAAVLIAAAVLAERRAAEPIMPGWLWRQRVLAGANLSMVGMGLVMMAPDTYLPIFAQSVLGHGAIAAGFVLASMSIGWPFASSVSGRLYMHIGFRDTALAGAVLVLVAIGGFLALPFGAPTWPVVLDQVVLGAGFGLLSTPMLVGVQSTVGWEQRGVVTGANMFSRYLGQSLGAAIFGAIFNGTIRAHLANAPTVLAGQLPQSVNDVVSVANGHRLGAAASTWLRTAIYDATHHLYLGMLLIAAVMIVVVLMTPRRFALAAGNREVPGRG